jgi:hypothetical protein
MLQKLLVVFLQVAKVPGRVCPLTAAPPPPDYISPADTLATLRSSTLQAAQNNFYIFVVCLVTQITRLLRNPSIRTPPLHLWPSPQHRFAFPPENVVMRWPSDAA